MKCKIILRIQNQLDHSRKEYDHVNHRFVFEKLVNGVSQSHRSPRQHGTVEYTCLTGYDNVSCVITEKILKTTI